MKRKRRFEVAICDLKLDMKKTASIQRSIESRIVFIRGLKVLLDRDIAELFSTSLDHAITRFLPSPSPVPSA
jgi:hypothetical protein